MRAPLLAIALIAAVGCATASSDQKASINHDGAAVPEVCVQNGCIGDADASENEACISNGCVSVVEHPRLKIDESWKTIEAPELIAFQAPLSITHNLAAVGPGFVDSFSVPCTTSATDISSSLGTMISYTCQNASTTKVAVGDSGIGDPTDAQNSPVYCATNCPSQEWGGNARIEKCRADSGTVTIYCRALISASTAP